MATSHNTRGGDEAMHISLLITLMPEVQEVLQSRLDDVTNPGNLTSVSDLEPLLRVAVTVLRELKNSSNGASTLNMVEEGQGTEHITDAVHDLQIGTLPTRRNQPGTMAIIDEITTMKEHVSNGIQQIGDQVFAIREHQMKQETEAHRHERTDLLLQEWIKTVKGLEKIIDTGFENVTSTIERVSKDVKRDLDRSCRRMDEVSDSVSARQEQSSRPPPYHGRMSSHTAMHPGPACRCCGH